MDAGLIMAPHLKIARVPGRELASYTVADFVYGTFKSSARQGKWRGDWRLDAHLATPGSLVLVAAPAVGELVYVGWLACVPAENRIICAYTKAAYRASPEQRRGREENADAFRIASSLALAGGISFDRPVKCSFWSRAARAIAEKPGNPYSLQFDKG